MKNKYSSCPTDLCGGVHAGFHVNAIFEVTGSIAGALYKLTFLHCLASGLPQHVCFIFVYLLCDVVLYVLRIIDVYNTFYTHAQDSHKRGCERTIHKNA